MNLKHRKILVIVASLLMCFLWILSGVLKTKTPKTPKLENKDPPIFLHIFLGGTPLPSIPPPGKIAFF